MTRVVGLPIRDASTVAFPLGVVTTWVLRSHWRGLEGYVNDVGIPPAARGLAFRAAWRTVWVPLVIAVAACAPEETGRAKRILHAFEGTLYDVDCTTLPEAPADLPSSQDLYDALDAGTARVLLSWDVGEGPEFFLSPPVSALIYGNPNYSDPTWTVQSPLACAPEAFSNVSFTSGPDGHSGAVAVGAYALQGLGFSVPSYEQGSADDTERLTGKMVITERGARSASGMLDGTAYAELKSHVGQERLGIEVGIVAYAFREASTDD